LRIRIFRAHKNWSCKFRSILTSNLRPLSPILHYDEEGGGNLGNLF
jgi:hypothetical protein